MKGATTEPPALAVQAPNQLEPKPHGFAISYKIAPTPISAARWLNACRERHKESQKRRAA